MAASCKICHEKLNEIIHKNKHKSHNLIIYLYSETPDLYSQFNNSIPAHCKIPVFPLSEIQKQLQIFVFPTFIRINSEATITKFFQYLTISSKRKKSEGFYMFITYILRTIKLIWKLNKIWFCFSSIFMIILGCYLWLQYGLKRTC